VHQALPALSDTAAAGGVEHSARTGFSDDNFPALRGHHFANHGAMAQTY